MPQAASAISIKGALPWTPAPADPPEKVTPGPWQYFTADEAAAMEALVDRLIPPDAETPGGKDTGCAVFIDRQLGRPLRTLRRPLHVKDRSRRARKNRATSHRSRPRSTTASPWPTSTDIARTRSTTTVFAKLSDEQKDQVIKGMEDGSLKLEHVDSKFFFDALLIDTQQGFFADPIYGGNKDMASWKMIGFPGARYDYRDWVHRHNERFPLPPVGISDHPNWKL